MIVLGAFITFGLYIIVFSFAYQLYQDRHEFFPKPDWRDKVITREQSDILNNQLYQELSSNSPDCDKHLHRYHDGCPACDMSHF